MSTERDPPRLSRGGDGVPPALSRALGAARARLPGDAVLSAVAARLPPGPPGGGAEGGGDPQGQGGPPRGGISGSSTGGGPLTGAGAPLAAVSSMWSGVFVGAALGALVGGASLFVPMGSPAPSGPDAAASVSPSVPATSERAPAARDPAPPTSADAPRPADQPAGSPASAPAGAPSDSPSSVPAGKTSSVPADSPSASPAETEADYLRRAHAQIASSPLQALALAEAHPLRYPDGKLGQEREMIVVGALAALGRTSEAQARGRAFLARFPDSAFRRRLEVIVPGLADPEK